MAAEAQPCWVPLVASGRPAAAEVRDYSHDDANATSDRDRGHRAGAVCLRGRCRDGRPASAPPGESTLRTPEADRHERDLRGGCRQGEAGPHAGSCPACGEQVSARAVPVAARAAGGRRAYGVPRWRQEQGWGVTDVIEYSVRSWGVKLRRTIEQARLSQAAAVAGQVVIRPEVSSPRISVPSELNVAYAPSPVSRCSASPTGRRWAASHSRMVPSLAPDVRIVWPSGANATATTAVACATVGPASRRPVAASKVAIFPSSDAATRRCPLGENPMARIPPKDRLAHLTLPLGTSSTVSPRPGQVPSATSLPSGLSVAVATLVSKPGSMRGPVRFSVLASTKKQGGDRAGLTDSPHTISRRPSGDSPTAPLGTPVPREDALSTWFVAVSRRRTSPSTDVT